MLEGMSMVKEKTVPAGGGFFILPSVYPMPMTEKGEVRLPGAEYRVPSIEEVQAQNGNKAKCFTHCDRSTRADVRGRNVVGMQCNGRVWWRQPLISMTKGSAKVLT
jgi:hypothetical protein